MSDTYNFLDALPRVPYVGRTAPHRRNTPEQQLEHDALMERIEAESARLSALDDLAADDWRERLDLCESDALDYGANGPEWRVPVCVDAPRSVRRSLAHRVLMLALAAAGWIALGVLLSGGWR